MIGYGFYGANHLLDDTAATPPSFTPYSNCSSRIKNKSLYKSIMSNSIIDWREKDFTGIKKGSGITYVNDRDFLLEPDWEDLFNNFSNNISFIHSLRPQGRDQIKSILSKNYITSKICIPIDQLNIDDIKYCLQMNGAVFDITNITNEKLFSFIFLIVSRWSAVYGEEVTSCRRSDGYIRVAQCVHSIMSFNNIVKSAPLL